MRDIELRFRRFISCRLLGICLFFLVPIRISGGCRCIIGLLSELLRRDQGCITIVRAIIMRFVLGLFRIIVP